MNYDEWKALATVTDQEAALYEEDGETWGFVSARLFGIAAARIITTELVIAAIPAEERDGNETIKDHVLGDCEALADVLEFTGPEDVLEFLTGLLGSRGRAEQILEGGIHLFNDRQMLAVEMNAAKRDS